MDNFIEKIVDDSLKIWNESNQNYLFTDNSSKNIIIYSIAWSALKNYVEKNIKFVLIFPCALEEFNERNLFASSRNGGPILRSLFVWKEESEAENYRVLIPKVAFSKFKGYNYHTINETCLGCGNFFIADPKRTVVYNKDLKAKDETGRIDEVKIKMLEDKVAELTEKISNLLR